MAESAYIPRIRLYVSDALGGGQQLTLDKMQSHYLAQVMRQRKGDAVCLFNGQDGEWRATLLDQEGKALRLQCDALLRPQQSAPDIWLAFAPIKSGRIDFLAEKATELGAAQLMPVQTARTIVNRINAEKLEAHLREAAEQSERLEVPVLTPLQPLRTLLKEWPEDRVLIYADETHQGSSPAQIIPPLKGQKIGLLIGPEGGFSPEELAALRQHPQAKAMSLGPRILRADTAALAALTCVMALLGEW